MFNTKYIITPDAKPLHAMAKCWGPEQGPLHRPTPVKMDILKDILMQKDAPTIYEVIPTNPQLTRWTTPVQLTLENFELPYDEILAPKVAGDAAEEDSKESEIEQTPIAPASEVVTEPVSKTEEVLKKAPEYVIPPVADPEPNDYTDEELELLKQMEAEENEE